MYVDVSRYMYIVHVYARGYVPVKIQGSVIRLDICEEIILFCWFNPYCPISIELEFIDGDTVPIDSWELPILFWDVPMDSWELLMESWELLMDNWDGWIAAMESTTSTMPVRLNWPLLIGNSIIITNNKSGKLIQLKSAIISRVLCACKYIFTNHYVISLRQQGSFISEFSLVQTGIFI